MPKGLMVHTTGSSVAGAGQVHKFLNDGSAVFGSGSAAAGIDNKSITMFDATNGAGSVTVYGNLSASVNLSASGFYGDGSNLSGVTANSIKADDIAQGDAAVTLSTSTGAINITPAAGSAIVLDGTINVDAGVVTGATSITSTAVVATTIGHSDDSDVLTFANNSVTIAADSALTYKGTAVTATGAELNYLDITTLGTSEGSKALTANADGDITIAGASANVVWDKSANSLEFADNAKAMFGTGDDASIHWDGSALKIGTDTSGAPITIGHGTSEVTIGDNLTVTGDLAATLTTAAQTNITSLGTLTALTVDNIAVDGTTIGHTGDTDLLTLGAQSLTIAADSALTYKGTAVTATGAELNYLDITTLGSSEASKALTADASGDVTVVGASANMVWDKSADLLTVPNLTVNGTTTTVNSTNTVVKDSLIGLNEGAGSNANDCGFIIERGSTGNNAILMWDESEDKWTMGTGTATPDETGNLSNFTAGTLVVGSLEGTLATAAQTNVTSLGTLTALTVDNIEVNGTTIGHTSDTDLMTLASGVLTVAGEVVMTTLDIGGDNITAIITESEGISSNDNDAGLPTAAAVKDYVDNSASNISPTNEASDVENFLIFTNAATGAQGPKTNTKLTLNAASDHLMMSGTLFAHTASVTDLNAAVISGSSNSNMEISSDQDLVFVIDANNTGTQNYTFKSTTSSIAEMDDAGSLQLSGGLSASLGISGSELYLKGVEVTSTAAELNLLDGTADAAYDQTADSVVFYDATDSKLKYEAANDFATALAGDGLDAASGKVKVDVSDFAGTGLEDDGSENLRLAAQGTGIAGGAGSTLSVAAAQTGITSVLNTSLVVGRDADNQIKFGTDDQIVFEVAGGDGVTFKGSGEIEATSLDISGDADIDGTLEADAITVDGTALAEVIADTAGAMFSSNTETGISATYQDADNTIDLEIAAAQTSITSIINASLGKIGTAADQEYVTFGTANEVNTFVNNTERLSVTATGADVTGNLTVSGDLTINGTTTTVSTTNMLVEDKLVELANGQSGTPSGDIGMVFERGDSDNAFMGWDESADEFHLATTSATGASTGDLTLASAHLRTKSNRLAGYDKDTAADLSELNAIATTPSNYNGMVFYVSDAPTTGTAFEAGIHTSGKFYFVEGGVIYPSPFTNS